MRILVPTLLAAGLAVRLHHLDQLRHQRTGRHGSRDLIQGILAGEVEGQFQRSQLFQLADGGFGHGLVDPLPALDRALEVEAAADHLAEALSRCAA